MTATVEQGAARPGIGGRAGGRTGDALSILLSSLCLVHCLVLSVAAGALSLAGAGVQTAWALWALAFAAAALSGWTLLRERRGLSRIVIGLATLGVVLHFAGATETPSAAWGTLVTVFGGLILIAAHGLNWRRRFASPCGAC